MRLRCGAVVHTVCSVQRRACTQRCSVQAVCSTQRCSAHRPPAAEICMWASEWLAACSWFGLTFIPTTAKLALRASTAGRHTIRGDAGHVMIKERFYSQSEV